MTERDSITDRINRSERQEDDLVLKVFRECGLGDVFQVVGALANGDAEQVRVDDAGEGAIGSLAATRFGGRETFS